jgi:hypothetical protein
MRSVEDSVPGVQGPEAAGGGFSTATTRDTAAEYNQPVGAVAPVGQASDAAAVHGIAITQTAMPGGRVLPEFVAGQELVSIRALVFVVYWILYGSGL